MNSKKNNLLFSFILFSLILNAQITYESAFPNLDFQFPVEIQSPNDGTDRMFVVEQEGRIKVFPRNPSVSSIGVSTFLDITDRVSFGNGQEIGLLGLAFHPNFTSNNYIYVYYTTQSPVSGISVRMVLSRFTVSSGNINLADKNSELIIFQFDKNINESNHNGGKIAFGTDGYLYISFGDGGGGNDPNGNAQNINNVFGSMCRIDIDLDGNNPVETNSDLPNGNYEIPSDNPFIGLSGLDEIYAYGLRNTWKFSFDEVNGTLWGADVGQNQFEEINIIEKGKNYGWNSYEGNNDYVGPTITGTVEFPVFFYNRSQGDVSITGGYVYRGSEITSINPNINSKYIFGDYVSGRVWALNYNATTGDTSNTLLFKTNGQSVSSFGVDKNGEIYFSDYGNSVKIYKLIDGKTEPTGNIVNGIGEWNSLAEGVINGVVEAIAAAPNGNVYHGGNFNQVGDGIAANNIAVWNKNLGWKTLGNGSNGTINALKIASNGDVYVGGSFSEIGDISANNIAVWNGSFWKSLGSGINGSVASLEIAPNGDVYIGGIFEQVNGETVRNIVRWNGSWSPLNDASTFISGTNNEVRSLAIDSNGVLYVGGNFDEAGGIIANRIATWDGSNWGTLGDGTSGFVEAITTTDNDVYIGGNFAIAGGITVNRIAKWNKTTKNWSALGNGLSNIVYTLLHDGSNLYAGGAFNQANLDDSTSIIVNKVAQWSSANGWKALGKNTTVGVDIKINTMQFAEGSDGINKIYAGGNFSKAGSISANNTAQWSSESILNLSDTQHKANDFYLYPNPTNGLLKLSNLSEWKLINSFGKIIKTGKSKELYMMNYPSGLYFLKINNDKTFKIIKQ